MRSKNKKAGKPSWGNKIRPFGRCLKSDLSKREVGDLRGSRKGKNITLAREVWEC